MLTLSLADLQHLSPLQAMAASLVSSLPFAFGFICAFMFMEGATSGGDDDDPDGFV